MLGSGHGHGIDRGRVFKKNESQDCSSGKKNQLLYVHRLWPIEFIQGNPFSFVFIMTVFNLKLRHGTKTVSSVQVSLCLDHCIVPPVKRCHKLAVAAKLLNHFPDGTRNIENNPNQKQNVPNTKTPRVFVMQCRPFFIAQIQNVHTFTERHF